jgi:AmiR/NasT family two-component response regulator
MTIAVSRPDDAGDLMEMVETLQALLDMERERADSLKEAVSFARRTGIAVGLVMAQSRVNADDAFSRIHAASYGVHRQLREVVEAVIAGRLQL